MFTTTLGIVINASSILILYLLVYTLFSKYRSFDMKIKLFNEYMYTNDNRLKNLVDDINYNDNVLKNSID